MAVNRQASEPDGGRRQRFAGLTTSARTIASFLAGFLGFPQARNDNGLAPHEPGPALELECLRARFAPALLAAAERRSQQVGVGADQVLIHAGVISEQAYLERLAASTGLSIERLNDLDYVDCLLPDGQAHLIAQHGIMPIRRNDELSYVCAPRGYAVRRLARLIAQYPSLRSRLRWGGLAAGRAVAILAPSSNFAPKLSAAHQSQRSVSSRSSSVSKDSSSSGSSNWQPARKSSDQMIVAARGPITGKVSHIVVPRFNAE